LNDVRLLDIFEKTLQSRVNETIPQNVDAFYRVEKWFQRRILGCGNWP